MKAIDINVVLRLILNDDPVQAAAAEALLAETTFVPLGVLIETGWVLRSTYGQARTVIADALDALLDVPTVRTSDEAGVRWAIERYRSHGADLPDMLHIVASRGTDAFMSFDERLARLAGPLAPVPIKHPL